MSDSYLLQSAVPNCTASALHCALIETRLSPRYLEVAAEREMELVLRTRAVASSFGNTLCNITWQMHVYTYKQRSCVKCRPFKRQPMHI